MALLTTLNLARLVIDDQPSTEQLAETLGISIRQVMRHIEEARHLGAQIETAKIDGRYYWTCTNATQIEKAGHLAKWLRLEEKRSLT